MMLLRSQTLVSTLAMVTLALLLPVSGAASDAGASMGRWEKLPLPTLPESQRTPNISGIRVESGGTPWIMVDNKVCYWDGQQFKQPSGDAVSSGYMARFYGGWDRPLYITQRGAVEREGKVYRLSDGAATYVTTFYFGDSNDGDCLYVSKSKKLYNYGRRFLAVYSGGEWKRIEATLGGTRTQVFDTGSKVYFYYDHTLCSADSNDVMAERTFDCPLKADDRSNPIHGVLWGNDRVMFFKYHSPGVYAYNLESCRPEPTDGVNEALGKNNIVDAFAAADGSVWVAQYSSIGERSFTRISPSGETGVIKETVGLAWDYNRTPQYPNSILSSSDGSIWFGMSTNGVSRLKDGNLDAFGWSKWVNIGNVQWMFEGSQGAIYAASNRAVFAFHPNEAPLPIPAERDLWTEYALVSRRPVRDVNGNMWMFLKDHPDEVSCWNGREWTHMKTPSTPRRVGKSMADDQGHVIIEVDTSKGNVWYDISPKGIEEYASFESVIEAVIERGVKRLKCYKEDFGSTGFVLLPGGRAVYIDPKGRGVIYNDGKRADNIMQNGEWIIMESPKYGFLITSTYPDFRRDNKQFYTYDRGQIISVDYSTNPGARWVLGPGHFQPYEEGLVELHPELYSLVEMGANKRFYLLCDRSVRGSGHALGDLLPENVRRLSLGYHGGGWADAQGADVYRVFAGRAFPCDFSNTPVVTGVGGSAAITEDRSHNLWIYGGYDLNSTVRFFVKNLSGFRLKSTNLPTKATNSVYVTVQPDMPGTDASKLRLFWRLNGGPWCGTGTRGNSVTIVLPSSGKHKVEIMGMDEIGATTPENLTFTVDATVVPPDTKVLSPGPYEANDFTWKPPVAASSASGESVGFAYNIDSTEWRDAVGGRVSFAGFKPGTYAVRIAAQENIEKRDATPITLNVRYAPDMELIIGNRLSALGGPIDTEAKAAQNELRSFGPEIIPALQDKIKEIRQGQNAVWRLEEVIRRIERPSDYSD